MRLNNATAKATSCKQPFASMLTNSLVISIHPRDKCKQELITKESVLGFKQIRFLTNGCRVSVFKYTLGVTVWVQTNFKKFKCSENNVPFTEEKKKKEKKNNINSLSTQRTIDYPHALHTSFY